MSNPLMPLHATNRDESPIICIPGAGASVTAFIDLSESPHETVEDAALYNLNAVEYITTNRPIHLLGHSHGGLVAFEMALRLYEQGKPVASLTLIDSEPPEPTESHMQHTDFSEILKDFVAVFEGTFEKRIHIRESIIESGQIHFYLHHLHAALARDKCIPPNSDPEMLLGPLLTFAAAVRSSYYPTTQYRGKVYLVLASIKLKNRPDDMMQPYAYAAKWRRLVADLHVWFGPGHHFSILQPPQVYSVAKWWRESRYV